MYGGTSEDNLGQYHNRCPYQRTNKMRISNHLTRHFLQTNNGRITQLKKRLHVGERHNKGNKTLCRKKKRKMFSFTWSFSFCMCVWNNNRKDFKNKSKTDSIFFKILSRFGFGACSSKCSVINKTIETILKYENLYVLHSVWKNKNLF